MIERGDYGPIKVTKGKHKGKNGYYDNDEGALAVVYFGVPFQSEFFFLRHSSLEPIKRFLPLDRFVKENPVLAESMNVFNCR